LYFESRGLPRRRISPVASHFQIGPDLDNAFRRPRLHSRDLSRIMNQSHYRMLHPKVEAGEQPGALREKIQKIPLRHQRDELAVRRQMLKIGGFYAVTADQRAGGRELLMRQL
jgi:hypothetical protein